MKEMWILFIKLLKLVMKTSAITERSVIAAYLDEVEDFQTVGFDVKHILARRRKAERLKEEAERLETTVPELDERIEKKRKEIEGLEEANEELR